MSARRRLKFSNVDELAAEVRRLRPGYSQAGNWNLPQICWHLNKTVRFSMQPGATSLPKSRVERAVQWLTGRIVLTTGRVPTGISAPQRIVPPAEASEESIDEFLASLSELMAYSGEFGIHPRFGRLSRDQYMRVHFIHSAHHLGFLTPTNGQV